MDVIRFLVKAFVKCGDKYLLVRRSDENGPYTKGLWEVPGGKIKLKEGRKKAMLRELKEETGIEGKIITELPFLTLKNRRFNNKCHVFLVETDSEDVTLSKEHTDFKWLTPNEISKMDKLMFPEVIFEYLNHAENAVLKVES